MKGQALTPSVRNLAKRLESKCLLAGGSLVVTLLPTHRRLLQWCITEDLLNETALYGRQFTFTSALFQSVNEHLEHLGEPRLEQELARTSMQQARQGASEQKSVREGPRAHRVLRAVQVGQAQHTYTFIDTDWRDLDLNDYSELVVVENLDCFYALHEFSLPLAANALVIYRGDSVYSEGASKLRERWQATAKPSKYFGDLDIEGFRIAQHGGFQYIAVPPLAWFSANLVAAAYTPEQHERRLQLQLSAAAQAYLDMMVREQKAMLQQRLSRDILPDPLMWIPVISNQ
ncbi:DUF7281 domain-containing protein [Aliidiomarina celeris]|uniref:DUF7281 domain-containing protein n=1 Tax=Aliidiomarina celeris TaxID=2249428 RepID=UPI000DE977D0|nr:Wadjet anti-phage system protein JetD domain-containing protein [Aliidiomarina celeris]